MPAKDYLRTLNSALTSDDPKQWIEAAGVLTRCEQAYSAVEYLHSQKGKRPADVLASLITQAEQEARQCQALSHEQLMHRDELLRKALAVKEPGAAMLFMQAHKDGRTLTAQDRSLLQEALRAEAKREDKDALAHVAAFGMIYGLGVSERRAYQIVLDGLGESRQRDFASKYVNTVPGMALRLDAEEEAKARALAKELAGR